MGKLFFVGAVLFFSGCAVQAEDGDGFTSADSGDSSAEQTSSVNQEVRMIWRCDAKPCRSRCDNLIIDGNFGGAERCLNYCDRLERCEVIDL